MFLFILDCYYRNPRLGLLLIIGIVWSLVSVGQASPVGRVVDDDLRKASVYLKRYGYLSMSDGSDNEQQLFDVTVTYDGLTRFQRFNNLQVTGVLDDATRMLMAKPRCGVKDMQLQDDRNNDPVAETEAEAGTRRRRKKRGIAQWKPNTWRLKHLNYSVSNTPYENAMTQDQVNGVIALAFAKWSTLTSLSFEYKDSEDTLMQLSFGRTDHGDFYDFDENGGILAHAFKPPADGHKDITGEGRRNYNGDTHFDSDEIWATNGQKGISLLTVAVHEIGHALGIDHTSHYYSIMAPYYSYNGPDIINESFVTMNEFDAYLIQDLYGLPNGHERTEPAPTPPPEPTYGPDVEVTTPEKHNDVVIPDPCYDTVSAVFETRSSIYVVSNQNFIWHYEINGNMESKQEPYKVNRRFSVPEEEWLVQIPHVDAAYSLKTSNITDLVRLFSGNKYWDLQLASLENINKMQGRPITDLGFGPDIEKIDAVFEWDHNGILYAVSGDQYWRFEQRYDHVRRIVTQDRVEQIRYPKQWNSFFSEVPNNIDAAFTLIKPTAPDDDVANDLKQTYLIKGDLVYSIDGKFMESNYEFPKKLNNFWPYCADK